MRRWSQELLDCSERRYPQEVLLQRANELLGDAIAFGFPNKGGRRFDSEASDFGLKIHGHVICTRDRGAVSIRRATLGDEPKQRVTACRTGSSASNDLPILRTNSDDFRVGVFDGDEHIGLTLIRRDRLCHVRSPHFVDAISDDRAVMNFHSRLRRAMVDKPCSPITRRTRRGLARTPATRSRAHSLR